MPNIGDPLDYTERKVQRTVLDLEDLESEEQQQKTIALVWATGRWENPEPFYIVHWKEVGASQMLAHLYPSEKAARRFVRTINSTRYRWVLSALACSGIMILETDQD